MNELASRIRLIRSDGESQFKWRDRLFDLSGERVRDGEQCVAEKVWDAVHKILGVAWRKHRYAGGLPRLPLVLVGGGSRNPELLRAFERKLHQPAEEQPLINLELKERLQPGPDMSERDIGENSHMLLLALGLSHPVATYPKWKPPSQVGTFKRPEPIERFDANDMYSK